MIEMSEKSLVVQHNAIVEARYKLTVEEQRLIKTLVSQIHRDDEDFKTYEIRIIDLAKLLGISDTSYYDRVKKVTKKIIGNVLCFTDESGNEVQTSWISSAKYYKGKGIVALRFDPELKPYLLQLNTLFTWYELGNILRLKSMYSIRIYELLRQYRKLKKREFTVESLKSTLKIDSEYPLYKDFKKFVLVPSQKEISEKTDIEYAISEIKKGRKVIGLIFYIKEKNKEDGKASETFEAAKHTDNEEITLENKTVSMLVNGGVTKKMAEELVEKYGEERVLAAIAYTLAQQKEGKVKNPAGFVVKAVQDGYRDNKAEERARQEAAAKAEAAEKSRLKTWEKVKEQWGAWRVERTQAHIDAMDAGTLEREKAAWWASLAEKPALVGLIRKNADREALYFRMYMTGKTDGLGLAEWARTVGFDLSPFEELARRDGKL